MEPPFKKFDVALDLDLMRVGCPLIQARIGCDASILELVDTDTWEMSLTPGMKPYTVLSPLHLSLLVSALESYAKLRRVKQGR